MILLGVLVKFPFIICNLKLNLKNHVCPAILANNISVAPSVLDRVFDLELCVVLGFDLHHREIRDHRDRKSAKFLVVCDVIIINSRNVFDDDAWLPGQRDGQPKGIDL